MFVYSTISSFAYIENMKPQHVCSDESSESSRTIGQKLVQAYQNVKVALEKNRGVGTRQNQKEDPIRTIMFLGSWSHT